MSDSQMLNEHRNLRTRVTALEAEVGHFRTLLETATLGTIAALTHANRLALIAAHEATMSDAAKREVQAILEDGSRRLNDLFAASQRYSDAQRRA